MKQLFDHNSYIVETIIKNVKLRSKNGDQISKKLKDAWEKSKKDNANASDGHLSSINNWFLKVVVFPEIFLQELSDDKTYMKQVNTSLTWLNNEYQEYYELINHHFKDATTNRENSEYPLKWMFQNKKIVQNMNKKKNRYFYKIFNYIIQKRTSLDESKELAKQANIGKYVIGKKQYDYILYCPNPKYEDLRAYCKKDNLNLSPSKIYLYIQECIRHGIFIDKFDGKIRKSPKTRTKIYAIGYYNTFNKGKNFGRIYFLSKKRHEKCLRIFDAEYYKKTNRSGKKNSAPPENPIL